MALKHPHALIIAEWGIAFSEASLREAELLLVSREEELLLQSVAAIHAAIDTCEKCAADCFQMTQEDFKVWPADPSQEYERRMILSSINSMSTASGVLFAVTVVKKGAERVEMLTLEIPRSLASVRDHLRVFSEQLESVVGAGPGTLAGEERSFTRWERPELREFLMRAPWRILWPAVEAKQEE